MKKNILLVTIVASFLFTACQGSLKSDPSDAAPKLAGSMQSFRTVITKLLPVLVDPTQFNAPENRQSIDSEVRDLVEVSKQVVHNPISQNSEPSMKFISTAFSDDLRRAQESLESGKREYARYTLMNMTAYCIECHTRTSSGPSFSTPQLEKTVSSLKPMERGEYLLATRQFDRAFSEFENVIKKLGQSDGNLFDLEKAVRYALSISVKFQRDPKKSAEVVSLITKSEKSPYYLKQNAQAWASAIQGWKKEKPLKSSKPKEILRHSEGLVKEGRTQQVGIADRGGDVYFLRALSELNGVLPQNLSKDDLGRGLYLTGVAYEAVRDLSPVSLHESYFESCIRQVPHSKWAEKCFTKLQESIFLGYTGTSGTSLPPEVQAKLSDLQKLAFK